jgi:PAS domain S-box-containing protein
VTDESARPLPGPDPAEAETHEPLQRSEERFRLLVDAVRDYAIFILDPEGRVSSWNPGAERIKGYRADEIIGQPFTKFYPPEAQARGWPQHELAVARQVGRFEDEGWRIRKDGSRFWANVVITALHDPSGRLLGFAKITRDLTERRRTEEALRQSEERFRLLVESVLDYAIIMLDPGGTVTSWNQGAERITGYTAEEIIGRHLSTFYPPDAVTAGGPVRELAVALRQGRFEDEGWRVRKDGTLFWASVVVTAIHDRTGTLRGFAKVTRDLSERRRVETLEDDARRANEFLAMLAHELRNPLAPIRNAVAIMQATTLADPTVRWAHDLIERQVVHLTRLVDDLLDVSRVSTGKVRLKQEVVDLGVLVSRAVETARPLVDGKRHHVEIDIPPAPVRVHADVTRLSQVVLNLLTNAAKYTPAGGHIEVRVAAEEEAAIVAVRDDGIGIARDLLPRVFDLFTQGERSLDRSEGGLGVGLTVVRRLVEMHGGTVSAASGGPGQGSQFMVRLPLLRSDAADVAPSGERPSARAGVAPLSVLVVDDNLDSAESMALLLRLRGHDVVTAVDGPTALAQAARRKPDLVLLDIGLPGMSGFEAARQMRAMPGLADTIIVAITGYSQEQDREDSRNAGFDRHLVKPVAPDTIEKLLADTQEKRSR